MESNVIGLRVVDGKIDVVDLIRWISQRDAACAEYLVVALRKYVETPGDVTDI